MLEKIDMNVIDVFTQINCLMVIDKLMKKYLCILSEEDLTAILKVLEPLIFALIKFNDNIDLRLYLPQITKFTYILNLNKHLQISINNYYVILLNLYDGTENNVQKRNYSAKIFDISIKLLNDFQLKNKIISKSNLNIENKSTISPLNRKLLLPVLSSTRRDYLYMLNNKNSFYESITFRT